MTWHGERRRHAEVASGNNIKILDWIKIHRKYPDRNWEFKAISVRIDDNGTLRDIVYGLGKANRKPFKGVEIYTGSNYIVGASNPSRSARYEISKVPSKYRNVVSYAMNLHKKQNWSNEKYVNLN